MLDSATATPAAARAFARTRAVLPRGGLLPHDVWVVRHRAIVVLLWAHAVVIAVIVLLRGYGLAHTILEGGIVAIAATVATSSASADRVRSLAASFGLLSSSAVLVHLSGGYIEMHFHFFVMIIVISLYQDWWPFLLAVGYVVFHHGVVGVLDPASVYNHPDAVAQPWVWAGIHGAFILAASVASMAAWRLNEDLTRERVATEQRARALAEAGMKTREDFLAVATHELRTPVTSIKGYAQLALRGLTGPDADPDRLRQTLTALDGQTDRLGRLVSQLLDVSQLEAGRLQLELTDADLGALVAAQVSYAKHRTDRHTWLTTTPQGAVVRVDAGRIEQVVANLLENAIRYSPEGGTIAVDLRIEGTTARLAIADDGIGIAPDRMLHIFERFYQAHADRNYGGMGLGLYICASIVERHGGTIAASPRPDRGTVFTVTLPLQRSTVREGVPVSPSARAAGTLQAPRPAVIMIIEDDQAIREVVAQILTDVGYSVVQCGDGQAALEGLASETPDLILVDKLMPGMNGSAFAAAYRQRPGPHAPLVGVCAARDGAAWAATIGAIGYIGKPFDIADLVERVGQFLAVDAPQAG